MGHAQSPATTEAIKARDRARDELEAAREALQEAKQTRAVTVADSEDMGTTTSELAHAIDPSDFKGGQVTWLGSTGILLRFQTLPMAPNGSQRLPSPSTA